MKRLSYVVFSTGYLHMKTLLWLNASFVDHFSQHLIQQTKIHSSTYMNQSYELFIF